MATLLLVKMFQSAEMGAAGAWFHEQRGKARVAGAFLYAGHLGANESGWGTLFTSMPINTGITLACHEALKNRFHVQVFEASRNAH